MLNVDKSQEQLLLTYLPSAQKHIECDDINQLLEDLDDKITEIGFDSNYDLNEVGLKLQRLYDQLYNQN